MNRHTEALNYAIEHLKPYKVYIDEIILYGSCARHEQKYNSDVDIFIALRDNVSHKIIREMRDAVQPLDYNLPEVELKFGRKDSYSVSKQFEKNIKTDGRILWKRD